MARIIPRRPPIAAPAATVSGVGYKNLRGAIGAILAAVPLISGSGSVSSASGDLTPNLVVEYVDTSGVRQRTTVASDGSTSISGVAPFLVSFDASGTRSVATDGDDEPGNWLYIGHRFNYGENLGTTWTYPSSGSLAGQSMDEDIGAPMCGRAFTTTGTKTVKYKCKDSLGNETTIQLSVASNAPSSLTHIPVSNGAWPSWANNTDYSIDADGDYTSFGNISFTEKHNISIRKVGAGADPIVGQVNFETKNFGSGSTVNRSKNIRLFNVDVAKIINGTCGFDYCGVVNGRCRQMNCPPGTTYSFFYNDRVNASASDAVLQSIRYPRGLFLWNCGEINERANGDYCMITIMRGLFAYGIRFVNTDTDDGTPEHNIRGVYSHSIFRYCKIYTNSPEKSWMKMNAAGHDPYPGLPDVWDDTDLVGNVADDSKYGYPGHKCAVEYCEFSNPTSNSQPLDFGGFGPQNGTVNQPYEGVEMSGIENCVTATAAGGTLRTQVNTIGRYLYSRNFYLNFGAGAFIPAVKDNDDARAPPGWNIDPISESTNSRPVPSAFA